MRTVLDTCIVIAADVEPIPGELAISAATAHAHDARLVTRNPADFAALDGLVDVATA